MVLESSTVLTSLLAFAAYLLGLSVLVQVLQEVYKFMTSSKAQAYRLVLRDLLGPLWSQVERSQGAVNLQVRGPFQLFRLRPQGRLLPLDSQALSTLLERSAPTWVQRGLAQLRDEAALQTTSPGTWSPGWSTFLSELAEAPKGSAGFWTAQDIRRFLESAGHGPETVTIDGSARLSAEQLLQRFRASFLPDVVTVERTFPQLESNFEYAYRRRNLRQSFLIGLIATVALSFPVDEIWRASTKLSLGEALALAGQAQELAESILPSPTPSATPTPGGRGPSDVDQSAAAQASPTPTPTPTPTAPPSDDDCARVAKALEAVNRSLEVVAGATEQHEAPGLELFAGLRAAWRQGGLGGIALYILSCLFTAILLSFGAPFWNDAVGILSKVQLKRTPGGGPGSE